MQVSMSCPTLWMLHQFVNDQLTTGDLENIEAHVLQCTLCAQKLSEDVEFEPLIQSLRMRRCSAALMPDLEVEPIRERLHMAFAKLSTQKVMTTSNVTRSECDQDDTKLYEAIENDAFQGSQRKIAHFEILEKLGAGGTSVVYRAWDTNSDTMWH